MQKIMQGYETALGVFVWPIMFMGVIGYVYFKQRSYIAAAVAAMIIVSVFGNYMAGMEIWMSVMYILVALALTALLLIFLTRRRG